MSEEPGCSMKPSPFELLNHLTLPVILYITTNPPNDSGNAACDLGCSRDLEVNLVSRTRFEEALHGNTQKMHAEKRLKAHFHHASNTGAEPKHISLTPT